MPEELAPVDVPEPTLYLWHWFLDLSNRRRIGEAGPDPLGYMEIGWWSRLNGIPITPFEVEVIGQIDNLYLEAQAAARKKAAK